VLPALLKKGPEVISLVIYNVKGRKVSDLSGKIMTRGGAVWNTAVLPPGLYFARLNLQGRVYKTKVVICR
jgi:hypothetical protein